MKKIIYIVEDNRMMREFLQNILSSEYQVRLFEEGKEILTFNSLDETPSLIILDYELKGEKGSTVLSSIKTSEKFNTVPVVFLSGEKSSDVKISCLENGADDFISKPFNPLELKLRISRTIRNSTQLNMAS